MSFSKLTFQGDALLERFTTRQTMGAGDSILCVVGAMLASVIALVSSANGADSPPQPRELYLPVQPFDYVHEDWPQHFLAVMDQFDNTPADNSLTNAGVTLGRVLFYDPKLSANGSTSCASCHKQSLAFSDDVKHSVGLHGETSRRNSMSLVNTRFYQRGRYFWDERAGSLEEQVLMPIEDPLEMGHDLQRVVQELRADPIYPPLFQQAFGSESVTPDLIARALAQFVRSIVSYRSRYDIGLAQVDSPRQPFPNFSDQENLGKAQFFGRGNCASCHLSNDLPLSPHQPEEFSGSPEQSFPQAAFFTIGTPAVNGIDSEDAPDVDQGVGGVNGADIDIGRFKSPSLRNVALTGPYMHDGRFLTLDQVVEHYNWSVRPHPNLDSRLADFAANGLALPEVEKVALVAFLETLTDQHLLSDPKYSDPFQRPGVQTPVSADRDD